MKKILLLTTYDSNSASSRIRHISVMPDLLAAGYEINHSPFFDRKFLAVRYSGKKTSIANVIRAYLRRLKIISQSDRYDTIWVEKELFPYIPTWVEEIFFNRMKKPILIDLDDDWFAKYKNQIPTFLRLFVGKFKPIELKNVHYSTSNTTIYKKIQNTISDEKCHFLVPYIDLSKYPNSGKQHQDIEKIDIKIGWIGSPISSKLQLMPNIDLIKKLAKNYQIHLIGANEMFREMPNTYVHEWNLESEVDSMLECDIAFMPLTTDEFTTGKSGYKAIQFMALGIPVIASNLANTSDLLANGRGIIANTEKDWMNGTDTLAGSSILRNEIGAKARNWVIDNYKRENYIHDLKCTFQNMEG
jgi:glycosyltransferase involved in cell wall biosynthesis